MVSLDVYLNETSRHADVILPGPTPLERPHYDLALYQLAVRNVANWTPGRAADRRAAGVADAAAPDRNRRRAWARRRTWRRWTTSWPARWPSATASSRRPTARGPERLLDILLRGGPYDLTLADLEAAPHGVDLGPLTPRMPDILGTASGPDRAGAGGDHGRRAAAGGVAGRTGRRDWSSSDGGSSARTTRGCTTWNRWYAGRTGAPRSCNPADATRLGLVDGGTAVVRSRAGKIEVPVEVTDAIRPGVVSIPHGWGHDVDGTRTAVARAHAGVNSNLLADDQLLDALSGTAALNGIPVEIEAG